MKELKWVVVAILAMVASSDIASQSYAFGIKGGPSLSRQSWSMDGSRGLLTAYFGDAFIETASSDKFSFGASLGYHIRGSVQKFSGGAKPGGGFNPSTRYPSRLGNLSLAAYMKQYFPVDNSIRRLYYGFGGRLEYNVMKDLGRFESYEDAVKPVTYGILISGGYDWSLGELWGGFIELTVAPDFSKQIYLAGSRGPSNPSTGAPTTIKEGAVVNFSIELAVGIRLMHLITYIE